MTERFHHGIGGQLITNVDPTNDNGQLARSPVARTSESGSTSHTVVEKGLQSSCTNVPRA